TALVERVLGAALPAPASPAPARARLLAPLAWRRLGVGVDARHVLVTSGVLTTSTDVLPLAKIQSVRMTQGPWQRRLRLASVHADGAGRRLAVASALHRDVEEAEALFAELTDRARAARRR
ncbi:MAG TPA: PH domain-containing protein, partial [Mycobacteriales bacterium]|nr:PH domain-containing protein [Mycobacteriales bacterium]